VQQNIKTSKCTAAAIKEINKSAVTILWHAQALRLLMSLTSAACVTLVYKLPALHLCIGAASDVSAHVVTPSDNI